MTHLPLALPPLPPVPLAGQIEAVAQELEGLDLVRGAAELERISRDSHDDSPVLTPLLQGRVGQLGVRVTTLEAVHRVAAACARHGVPLTLRGAGTGNYGQCVPLAGGVVLDLGGLNRLRHIDPPSGVFTAEAGIGLARLDQMLRAQGRALRLQPSTARTASLGGFVAGGSGASGRCAGDSSGTRAICWVWRWSPLSPCRGCFASMPRPADPSTMPTAATGSSRP